MSERIRKLAEEAGLIHPHMSVGEIFDELKKFEKCAELIVRECVTVVADAVDHREPASTYASKIQQHFGVE